MSSWEHVRDFGGTGRPAGARLTLELTGDPFAPGTERRVTLDGGVPIRERLEAIDDAHRVLEYSLVEPLSPSVGIVR